MAGSKHQSGLTPGDQTRTTRRGAISGLIAASLYLGGSGPALASSALSLPSHPMRLTRILTRDLRGSARLKVTRNWLVRFTDNNGRIVITGDQLSARVDAPRALSQLARIEEARGAEAMFPIILSDRGAIIAAGSPASDQAQNQAMRQAIGQANALIAAAPLSENEKNQHAFYLSQLGSSTASLHNQMPADLFFPDTQPVRVSRAVPLPSGAVGEYEIGYKAYAEPGQKRLRRAIREVTTRIGSEERRSIEEWSLEPADPAGR